MIWETKLQCQILVLSCIMNIFMHLAPLHFEFCQYDHISLRPKSVFNYAIRSVAQVFAICIILETFRLMLCS